MSNMDSNKNVSAIKRNGFNPWVGKIPWKRKWQHTPVFLSGKTHGQSLTGYSLWGCKSIRHNLDEATGVELYGLQ